MVSTLDRLTRRLARLYLAGRVGCPAILLSGAVCRQELHRLPDRFAGIAAALRVLRGKAEEGQEEERGEQGVAPLLAHYANRINVASEVITVESRSTKSNRALHNTVLSEALSDVPSGQWPPLYYEKINQCLL